MDVHALVPLAVRRPVAAKSAVNPSKIRLFGSVKSTRHDDNASQNSFAPLSQGSAGNDASLKKLLKKIPKNCLLAAQRLRGWNRISYSAQSLCRWIRHQSFSRWIRHSVVAIAFFITILFAVLPPAVAAGSSGRMGGSFGSSHGRSGGQSTTRMYSSSPGRSARTKYYSPSPWSRGSGRTYLVLPLPYGHHHHHHPQPATREESTTTIAKPDGTTTIVRRGGRETDQLRFSLSDVILVTGAASLVAYGVSQHYQRRDDGDVGPDTPLGRGFSVLSLTACLGVPDRKDPNSILQRLCKLAEISDTSNRKGLQDLMSETSLELARQEKAIISVESHYDHMKTPTQAERQYNQLSAQQRSKFDIESLSNYGGKRSHLERNANSNSSTGPSATVALVNIQLAIEGNSLRDFDNIKSRKELKEALSRISSDVQVEECLMAGEVIWSPENPMEQLTMEDIYSDFPTLNTLVD